MLSRDALRQFRFVIFENIWLKLSCFVIGHLVLYVSMRYRNSSLLFLKIFG